MSSRVELRRPHWNQSMVMKSGLRAAASELQTSEMFAVHTEWSDRLRGHVKEIESAGRSHMSDNDLNHMSKSIQHRGPGVDLLRPRAQSWEATAFSLTLLSLLYIVRTLLT